MTNAIVKFIIEDARPRETEVLLGVDRSGDEVLSPSESVVLIRQKGGGSTVLWTGDFEIDNEFPTGAFYKFAFSAPKGATWHYEIKLGDLLLAKQERTKMTRKFDLAWGTLG